MSIIGFEPITSITFLDFIIYFIAYYSISAISRLAFYYLARATREPFRIMKIYELDPLLAGIVFPIAEELVFRGIPYFLTHDARLVFLGTIVWSLIHKYPEFIIPSLLFGILLYRYWIGGLWLYAILSHITLNLLNLFIAFLEALKSKLKE